MTIGALECIICPTNHTSKWPATGPEDCSLCEPGQWFDPTGDTCQDCSPPCQAPDKFEVAPCTDMADRVCSVCNRTCDKAGEFTFRCPGHDASDPGRGCGLCNNLPPLHAFYTQRPNNTLVLSGTDCTWACEKGFYATLSPPSCVPCTSFDSTTCPAGFILSQCTETADASCNRPCANSTFPTAHASYVLTQKVREEEMVFLAVRTDDDRGPNEGCLWRCDDGYSLYTTDGGLHTCRLPM